MYIEKELIDFQSDVIEASKTTPVLVDFWAEWCGPCVQLSPTLEKLAEEAGDSWTLLKVNTESQPELAAEYGIRSIPNVKLFVNGEISGEFVGALPEEEIKRWLESNIPDKSGIEKVEETSSA
ncbi:thioredoxin [Candidatus Marinimicrobia bacterium MT.SAG.3]|nr:thioredoxin [Candidatus Marinimicrobia bacterium MT.SAG.3]